MAVLREALPDAGTVLEIASGTGEHAVHFAAALPHLVWQPTEPDAQAHAASRPMRRRGGSPNLLPGLELDASAAVWPVMRIDAIVSINMIHIAPGAPRWTMAGAGVPRAAPLDLYGPYREHGRHTAPSNAAFDESLKARNPNGACAISTRSWELGRARACAGARSRCRRTI